MDRHKVEVVLTPRPSQEQVLGYRAGKMGVAAVPGSGKTWTLSALAAQLLLTVPLDDEQEILIVTLVNSAVDNFTRRVGEFVKESGLLPKLGYRVRTLHGLARDIVGERPDLVGLSDNFQIVDELTASRMLADIVAAWMKTRPATFNPLTAFDAYLLPDFDEGKRDWLRSGHLPRLLGEISAAFIKRAKDLRLTPEQIERHLREAPAALPLAEMGWAIYRDYQRALAYRGGLDFDDLIRLAVQALETDPDFLERLRTRWPYILEDEAQDSSQLQEVILRMLTGLSGNWVRVGDPNQAIFETFTTADPRYLREFLHERGVQRAELPNSGRSTLTIIDLANQLIRWVNDKHPVAALRGALTPPFIEPAPPHDPQPNPPDEGSQVHLFGRKLTTEAEVKAIADSLARWLPENPGKTVAVLVPRNTRGFALSQELQRRKIEVVEILRSANATRLAAGALGNVLNALADPKSPQKLATTYKVWRRASREDPEAKARLEATAGLLRKCAHVEAYLWPAAGQDWLATLQPAGMDPETVAELEAFRAHVCRWQEATLLPIDQLVLTLAQDLFTEPAELALAHKLAIVLKRASATHLDWRLQEMTDELSTVAKNERRFIGFSEDDTGFDPDAHKGKVVVTTMHKAKGLEWDRVYLMSVNNYDFPSAMDYDSYISEKWFIRDRLDLQTEALAQLALLGNTDEFTWYEEGQASAATRLAYAAERLRLFYVGITRARQELIVTYNTGQKGVQQQALPFTALQAYWETRDGRSAG